MTEQAYTSSPMPKLTFATGGVLVAIGLIATVVTSFDSWTSLIPAIIGVLLLISGGIALKNLMVGIHIALALAVIGALAMLHPIISGIADFTAPAVTALISVVVLVIYVALGVRSFLAARRWKKQNA
ncbi:hypothetical protein [Nesterenkonia alba]|uniref:hypothetical protein n=1 Tax=Nesterenkonia alba TaxID=515814 RepID=UPI0003B6D2DD|nr:hypothetical protein [Nesterenkonia alba]